MNELIFASIPEPLSSRVRAAAAICVAGEIFEQTMKRPSSPAKLLRTQMAGDVLNKTAPSGAIAAKYSAKPDDQSDLQFLLQNLSDNGVLEPSTWRPRQVSPNNWAEYTRVLRGVELFLKMGGEGAAFSKQEKMDVEAMLSFIVPQLKHLPDPEVLALLAP